MADSSKKKARPLKNKTETIRLNKYIAHAGICSRREADMHIGLGVVKVNNKVVTEMGYQVQPNDVVHFDGKRINPEKKSLCAVKQTQRFYYHHARRTWSKNGDGLDC